MRKDKSYGKPMKTEMESYCYVYVSRNKHLL